MNVYVATPEKDCAASRALRTENLTFQEFTLEDETDYGLMFHSLWSLGDPFVLVEWDIVPHPGAIKGLIACKHKWCAHKYPIPGGDLIGGLGLNKFVPEGPPIAEWLHSHWRMLDGEIVPILRRRLGKAHYHDPPVAHARRF